MLLGKLGYALLIGSVCVYGARMATLLCDVSGVTVRSNTFWAISDSQACFFGWILPLGWVSGWVGGMG